MGRRYSQTVARIVFSNRVTATQMQRERAHMSTKPAEPVPTPPTTPAPTHPTPTDPTPPPVASADGTGHP